MTQDNQIWAGIAFGINQTSPKVDQSFSIIENGEEKKYENITKYGQQISAEIIYEVKPWLGISLQPAYHHFRYGYTQTVSWSDESNDLSLKNDFDHALNYASIPLWIRFEYHFVSSGGAGNNSGYGKKKKKDKVYQSGDPNQKNDGKWLIYGRLGASYQRLLRSWIDVKSQETFNGFDSPDETDLVNSTEMYNKNRYDLLAGLGVSYDVGGSFRMSASFSYRYGLTQLTNQSERYSNEKLTTEFYHVQDDVKLNGWEVNLHLMFPLKFVFSNSFQKI